MTIGRATIDLRGNFLLKGVGEMHLRCKYGRIYCKIDIYEEDLRGNWQFEFEISYKYHTPVHIWKLLFFRVVHVFLHLKMRVCCCMYSYLSWKEFKQEFLKRGVGNIMTLTPPIHTITPSSPRPNPTASVIGDKK